VSAKQSRLKKKEENKSVAEELVELRNQKRALVDMILRLDAENKQFRDIYQTTATFSGHALPPLPEETPLDYAILGIDPPK